MIKEAIEKIVSLTREPLIKAENHEWILNGYSAVSKIEPTVDILDINTLTGLVDFIKKKIDSESLADPGFFIHILNYDNVRIVSNLFGPEKQRDIFLVANADDQHHDGAWMDAERFIINVNAKFKHEHDYEYIMQVVSAMSTAAEKKVVDNGYSQKTTISTGVTTVGEHEIRNPIKLQPFRTFPEIEQPIIDYVFRLRDEGRGCIECGLFECDGGEWKLNTIHAIRDYLKKEFDEGINIIA